MDSWNSPFSLNATHAFQKQTIVGGPIVLKDELSNCLAVTLVGA